ncbi:MAG: ABC transporter permease [Rhodothermaceae bacterium]|nr:ABC transporter permease [Rhodothermaceae bacterium]MXZ57091.1 ABC transporter permease [Rhodothermaceae bacterium]MYB90697.1 ABC transporter permease [Rhodothermaceae bacterium]MYD68033.1 ABC transporter permease [Rhodothermaceae bacterium]MYG44433.1 ABC transporter permease [Rhodothermaceae bacterium]
MNYRLFIAQRYLHSQQRIPLVTIISGISMAGVAVGVAALIVVLSVMNGFYDVVRDLLVSMDPHVRIVAEPGGGLPQEEANRIAEQAKQIPQVLSAEPYVEGKALLVTVSQSEVNRVVVLRGVADNAMGAGLVAGEFDTSEQGMVMGFSLGQRLGLSPGSENSRAMLFSAQGLGQMLTRVFSPPAVQEFEVRGLYKLEETYDNTHVFIGISEAQDIFHLNGAVTGIELRLTDLGQAQQVKQALEAAYPSGLRVQTWYDLQRSLYDVMQLEKWGASIILVLICVVAAFSIVGSLTMVVVEKKRDIGVLQAMGATSRDIRQLFLVQGGMIGLIGAGTGFVVGLGILLLQKYFQLVPLLGAESFVIEAYPVSIQILDLVLILGVSFGLCLIAALYPAWRAARSEPSQAVTRGH